MSSRLRCFEPSDISRCVEIVTDTLGPEDGRSAEADFIYGLTAPNTEYDWVERLVAEVDGQVVGVTGVYHDMAHPAGCAGVCWFAVARGEQRKGIGTDLMDAIEKVATSKGAQSLFAYTYDGAVSFYEKRAYRRCAIGAATQEQVENWQAPITVEKALVAGGGR